MKTSHRPYKLSSDTRPGRSPVVVSSLNRCVALQSHPTVRLPHSLAVGRARPSARLHPDNARLVDHISRHALEHSARAALVVAHPALNQVAPFACPIEAARWVRRGNTSECFDGVVAAYAQLVEDSLREAAELGFVVRTSSSMITLDSAGMVVVVEGDIVRTAFIPGIDYEFELPQSLCHRSHDERDAQARRCAQRSADEIYYFDVFRPAIQSIRRFPTTNPNGRAEYGALKNVLPSARMLSLEAWRSMRARLALPEMTEFLR